MERKRVSKNVHMLTGESITAAGATKTSLSPA